MADRIRLSSIEGGGNYGAPVGTLPPGTLIGQDEPVLMVTDPCYPIVINKEAPNDVAYVS